MEQKNEQKMIGRRNEFEQLQRAYDSKESELVIVYGRRRVGKTFLINEFFRNAYTFKLTGTYHRSTSVQLERFAAAMEEYFGIRETPADWFRAFDALKKALKGVEGATRKVVFIDEMPWLDTADSDFVAAFEAFWNGWAAAEGDILLVACGSATSWMTETLLGDRGGLFNRSSSRIYVRPFTLCETEQYLISRGIEWTRYDIAECYMIMGGIPFYLRQLNPRWTYTQNIDNLFFREKGGLWDEFEHLYATLFRQADRHILVVEALARKRMGMTRNEILRATGMPDNGKLGRILRNLESNEMVRPYAYFGSKKRDTIYQLSDFYTMFYFTYVKELYGRDAHFWTHSLDNPARKAWAGHTFEQLCKNHIEQIRRKIGIGAVLCDVSAWFSKGGDADAAGAGGPSARGAQIDLLIDRRDRVINVCEMKFSLDEFTIDKEYDAALRNKLDTFRRESKTRKALQLTMVTTYGVKRNMYSNRVQAEVTLDDLFAE